MLRHFEMARVICVFGATGTQGGGVVTALLKNNSFKVRAVTRNTASDKAKALQNRGAEVVQGNLDDTASLSKVLAGCYGVFGVTDYWSLLNKDKEIKQGKGLVDACEAAGVKHLIFSGLESVKEAIGKEGPHYDGKHEIEKYMFASKVPSTSVRYAAFMENMLSPSKAVINKDADGKYSIGMAMEGKPMHMIDCTGAGRAVAAIFASPEPYYGKAIGFSGDKKTVQEYADIMNKHLAPKVFKASDITADQLGKLGFPGADDFAAMFAFLQQEKDDRNIALTRELDPSTLNFDDWVKANKDALSAVYD